MTGRSRSIGSGRLCLIFSAHASLVIIKAMESSGIICTWQPVAKVAVAGSVSFGGFTFINYHARLNWLGGSSNPLNMTAPDCSCLCVIRWPFSGCRDPRIDPSAERLEGLVCERRCGRARRSNCPRYAAVVPKPAPSHVRSVCTERADIDGRHLPLCNVDTVAVHPHFA